MLGEQRRIKPRHDLLAEIGRGVAVGSVEEIGQEEDPPPFAWRHWRARKLLGIGQALKETGLGVFQCISDFNDIDYELGLMRRLVEEWTDSMAYCCRRSAARARGEDPGEWVPQWKRRPDLVS